jgi:AmmeMemoRadiSam system protein A
VGELVFAGVVPHPAIIVEEVGGGHNKDSAKTIEAMDKWTTLLKQANPDVIVIITPHGNVFQDAIAIQGGNKLTGSFANFGVPKPVYEFVNHLELQQLIREKIESQGFSTVEVNDINVKRYGLKKDLDHGVLVPLYFVKKKAINVPIVVVSMAFLDYDQLYKVGMIIEEAIAATELKAALVASGDLSHRLTPDAPAGFDPAGKEFDKKIVDIISQGQLTNLLKLDEELIDRAGECGLRPLIMLAGSLDKYKVKSNILNYEGPYGVGYLVASMQVDKGETSSLSKYNSDNKKQLIEKRNNESIFVKLARESLEYYLKTKKYLPVPSSLPEELKERKACFVSLKKNGHLRGCIGTIKPVRNMLANEIIENSVSAGLRDPRFLPVSVDEIPEIDISVDVLSEPEKVDSIEKLDPALYGVIVKTDNKSGVLLPNLEGVDSVEMQLGIALNKAGIKKNEPYDIYRFRVDRYY